MFKGTRVRKTFRRQNNLTQAGPETLAYRHDTKTQSFSNSLML